MESEEGGTICTHVCPVLRAVENWIVMPILLPSSDLSVTVFAQKHHKEKTSSEPALFSLARKQGSPLRALTQRESTVAWWENNRD